MSAGRFPSPFFAVRRRPFSIVRRLTILVVAVSLLILCLNAYLFVRSTQPLNAQLASTLARSILLVRTALLQAPAGQRDAMAKALRFGGFMVHRAATAPSLTQAPAPFDPLPFLGPQPMREGPPMFGPPRPPGPWGEGGGRPRPEGGWRGPGPGPGPLREGPPPARLSWADQLRSKLDFHITMTWLHPAEPGPVLLRVGFVVDQDNWVIDLAGGGRPPIAPLLLALLLMVGVGLAAALVTVVGVRWITRPMARLADEVTERQRELRPIDQASPVAAELQPLVEAFNGLVGAVTAADATRQQLLAGLSHDLRTPLARLRLRMECMCPDDQLESMEHDFRALAHIVDQFLAYAQGEAEVAPGSPEPLGLLAQRIADSHGEGKVQVEIEDAAAGELLVPDIALHRVLSNLIDNAAAHGVPPIVLRIRSVARECQLLVLDGGQGIGAERFEEAQQPFVRLQPGRVGIGHCGLGLAIVAQIARRLHGRVFLHAFDGQQSGVGIALPFPAHA
ncbi:MAG: HAMP domain-containing sensor histidine kinase [Pseudorhodoferax sp.]